MRVIATDLDGTLLDQDGETALDVRTAIRKLQAAGVTWIATTARSIKSIDPREWWWRESDEMFLCNGAARRASDGLSQEVVCPVSQTDVDLFLRNLMGLMPSPAVAIEDTAAFHVSEGFPRLFPEMVSAIPLSRSRPESVSLPVLRIVVFAPDLPALFLLRVAAFCGLHASQSGSPGVWEVTASSATKGNALANYCGSREIDPSAVAAIGDGENDVSMLLWAGRSYAMVGAPPLVQSAASQPGTLNHSDLAAALLELVKF